LQARCHRTTSHGRRLMHAGRVKGKERCCLHDLTLIIQPRLLFSRR
jgi:hypothetical protein